MYLYLLTVPGCAGSQQTFVHAKTDPMNDTMIMTILAAVSTANKTRDTSPSVQLIASKKTTFF